MWKRREMQDGNQEVAVIIDYNGKSFDSVWICVPFSMFH